MNDQATDHVSSTEQMSAGASVLIWAISAAVFTPLLMVGLQYSLPMSLFMAGGAACLIALVARRYISLTRILAVTWRLAGAPLPNKRCCG